MVNSEANEARTRCSKKENSEHKLEQLLEIKSMVAEIKTLQREKKNLKKFPENRVQT